MTQSKRNDLFRGEWNDNMDDHGTDLSPDALADAIESAEIVYNLEQEFKGNMAEGETEIENAVSICEDYGNKVVAKAWFDANDRRIDELEKRARELEHLLKKAVQAYELMHEAYETLSRSAKKVIGVKE